MVANEVPARNPEKQKELPEIPKSREIFTGDINDAVIAVQQITGFEISPDWWMSEVGNYGTTEEILDRFDDAFEKFVRAQMGIETPETEQDLIIAEAESELCRFDDETNEDPGLEPLRGDFLEALKNHLEEKYLGIDEDFEDSEITYSQSKDYQAEIRVGKETSQIKITEGVCLETSRFVEVSDLPICKLFGSRATTDEMGMLTLTVPNPEKINQVHSRVFGEESNYLTVKQVESDNPEFDAKTYWGYLAEGIIPVSGPEDANYFIHDRAVDDHVLGNFVCPDELNQFLRKAGEAISDPKVTEEDARTAIAAYDFLTSTITLYAWRKANGPEAPLPLRGDVSEPAEAQREESKYRLSYATRAITQMLSNIEKASGVSLEIEPSEILEMIDKRVAIIVEFTNKKT